MAEQTPNYNLTKPDSEDFYDVEVQNSNMDIIDASLKGLDEGKAASADLTFLEQTVTEHLADKFAYSGTFVRDGQISGTQKISLPFKAKAIFFFSTNGVGNFASWGFSSGPFINHLMGNNGNNATNTYNLIPTKCIAMNGASAWAQAAVISIEDDGFTIEWAIDGGGIVGGITTYFIAFNHGGAVM